MPPSAAKRRRRGVRRGAGRAARLRLFLFFCLDLARAMTVDQSRPRWGGAIKNATSICTMSICTIKHLSAQQKMPDKQIFG
jgi:hypothetical protein